jgi:hypothetical protein
MIVIYARRDAVDAIAPSRAFARGRTARSRTAKSCGPDAPLLAFKSRRSVRAMMVTTKPGRQGEHEGNRKTIVQGMPVETGEPVALPGHFCPHGCIGHPAFPAPSFLGRTRLQTSGASCRENEKLCPAVIARSILRRSNPVPHVLPWIASRSLSSGGHSPDPLARNDVSVVPANAGTHNPGAAEKGTALPLYPNERTRRMGPSAPCALRTRLGRREAGTRPTPTISGIIVRLLPQPLGHRGPIWYPASAANDRHS